MLRRHVYHSMFMEVGGQLCESSYLPMHRFWGLNLDHHTFSTNNFYLISHPLGSLSLYPTLVYLFIFFLFFRRVHSVAWLVRRAHFVDLLTLNSQDLPSSAS